MKLPQIVLIASAVVSIVNGQGQPLRSCAKTEHPPVDLDTYYSPVTRLDYDGEEFRAALSSLIDGHKVYSYSPCIWHILQEADEHPDDSDSILAIYTQRSIKKSRRDYGQNDPDSWNREHIWSKSHGFPAKAQDAYTDAHHLVAADRSCNSDRSDKDFREGGSLVEECNSHETSTTWEPPDEAKGAVARMMFYMATRYEGYEGPNETPDLELIDEDSARSTGTFGYKSALHSWHCKFPVTERERRRNDVVYSWQGNRNPFIDHPEFVERIWGPCPDDEGPTPTTPEPPSCPSKVTREDLIESATEHLNDLKRLPTSSVSCAAFGCRRYTPGQPCQCNSKCARYRNCCDDYNTVCAPGSLVAPVKILDLLADAKSHPANSPSLNANAVVTMLFTPGKEIVIHSSTIPSLLSASGDHALMMRAPLQPPQSLLPALQKSLAKT